MPIIAAPQLLFINLRDSEIGNMLCSNMVLCFCKLRLHFKSNLERFQKEATVLAVVC